MVWSQSSDRVEINVAPMAMFYVNNVRGDKEEYGDGEYAPIREDAFREALVVNGS